MIKQCKNFQGYGADELGNIYSFKIFNGTEWGYSELPVKQLAIQKEYCGNHQRLQPRCCVHLKINGKRTKRFVHQLVADAFLEKTHQDDVVLHKNDITSDCRLENLMYGSKKVNIQQREFNIVNDVSIEKLNQELKRLQELLSSHNIPF